MATKAPKKLSAATLARRIDQWAKMLYGDSVLDAGSKSGGTSLAEFIDDVRNAEFAASVNQIPGQTRAEADKDGNVSIVEDTGPRDPDEDTAEAKAAAEGT